MSIDDAKVGPVTVTIWKSILDLDLAPLPEIPPESKEPASTACILISGPWEGAVMFQCGAVAAKRFAAKMFEMTVETVSADEVDDALGELINLVGGNFKNQIGGVCALSLPTVVHGREHVLRVPQSKLLHRMAFDNEGDALVVSVFERDRGQVREPRVDASRSSTIPT